MKKYKHLQEGRFCGEFEAESYVKALEMVLGWDNSVVEEVK